MRIVQSVTGWMRAATPANARARRARDPLVLPQLRRSASWVLPIVLFALVAFLLQPAACALCRSATTRANHASTRKVAQVAFFDGGMSAADPGACCNGSRLTNDSTAQPSNTVLLHFTSSGQLFAAATAMLLGRAIPGEVPAVPVYQPASRALPYHTRSTRLLI